MGELLLRRLYARKVEVALLRRCDRARDILLRLGSHRVECASCGSHGGTAQCSRTLGEAAFDLANDGGNLRHIVNLSVKHGARLVLQPFGGKDMELPVTLFGDDADDTARADVERKDQFRGALTPHRGMGCGGLSLLWATAPFGRAIFRLFLYAFFGTTTPFSRRVCIHLFVRFIQIRHFDLPRSCVN